MAADDYSTLDYSVQLKRMPRHLAAAFIQMELDDGTRHFLDNLNSHWYERGCWKYLQDQLGHLAKYFMSSTDANALLDRCNMHVLSTAQFTTLLLDPITGPVVHPWSCPCKHPCPCDACRHCRVHVYRESTIPLADAAAGARVVIPRAGHGLLLDVGAGTGNVTDRIAPLFTQVTTTEMSTMMARKLRRKGYVCHEVPTLDPQVLGSPHYDTVCFLNLLDRCDNPLTMLRQARELISPNGLLLVALVMPVYPSVEVGTGSRLPVDALDCRSMVPKKKKRFEEWVEWAIHEVFFPAGFSLIRWTKVPYISQGDTYARYYVLYDAVFVLTPAPMAGAGARDDDDVPDLVSTA